MKKILGILMILGGIGLGLYIGLWWCLIGGIVSIVNALKAPGPVEAMVIAGAITRILFASVAGWVSAMVLIIPGFLTLTKREALFHSAHKI